MTAPDTPEAEAEVEALTAAFDLLADPFTVAARAMQLAMAADELHAEIVTGVEDWADPDWPGVQPLLIRQRSALAVANALTDLAEFGRRFAADEREANPGRMLDLGDDEGAEAAPVRPEPLTDGWPNTERPEPLQARFTARLEGEPFLIADVEMLFVPGNGWINIDHFERDGRVFTASGRARSRYRGQILVTLDSGAAMTLPEALVTLEPDE